jgi:hypothetical protein
MTGRGVDKTSKVLVLISRSGAIRSEASIHVHPQAACPWQKHHVTARWLLLTGQPVRRPYS